MEQPKKEPLKDSTQRFPRKVTKGVSKKNGRAKRRRRPHAAPID